MTLLIIGWIVAMWLIVLFGSVTDDHDGVVGLQFVAMLAGVLVIGVAGMFSIL